MSTDSLTDPKTNGPLDRALSCAAPRSIRLLAELIDPAEQNKPLLVASPVNGPWGAVVAGDLAAAANDMGNGNVRILDLRKANLHSNQPEPELIENSPESDGPNPSLRRRIQVVRPASALVARSQEFRQWVLEWTVKSNPLVILAGGVLDPDHWLEDPLSWAFLEPTVLVACGHGLHTSEQVDQTRERLQRSGLNLAGSVMVKQKRSFNPGRLLNWFLEMTSNKMLYGRRVEA